MATEEYVDAGSAIPYATLSTLVGKAPPVAKGVNYERILNARDEPQNWLTYYGAYNGQRYSPLDQINASNVGQITPQWVFQAGNTGLRSGATTYAWEASPIIVDGVMYVSAGTASSGPSTQPTARSCGATGTRPRSTCRCAAATSTAGSPSPRGRSS